MAKINPVPITPAGVLYPMLFILTIWGIYWVEIKYGFNFNYLGTQPRTLKGLRGILFTPLLHGSLSHLFSNTIPLGVLSIALFYFYRDIVWPVSLLGFLMTGVLTWLIGRAGSNHIGASGIVYFLASFLFFKGIWSKNYRLIAVALIVVFLYGSLVWGVFPGEERISWEGHLSGFITGIAMALLFKKYEPEFLDTSEIDRRVSKREIEFLKHFDEEGNFVSASEMKRREEAQNNSSSSSHVEIIYKYESSSKEEE